MFPLQHAHDARWSAGGFAAQARREVAASSAEGLVCSRARQLDDAILVPTAPPLTPLSKLQRARGVERTVAADDQIGLDVFGQREELRVPLWADPEEESVVAPGSG